jgi:hypothetical protein
MRHKRGEGNLFMSLKYLLDIKTAQIRQINGLLISDAPYNRFLVCQLRKSCWGYGAGVTNINEVSQR